jgi:hypothetical protein
MGAFQKTFKGKFSIHKPFIYVDKNSNTRSESLLSNRRERPFYSFFLYHYLQQQDIPLDLAKPYYKEVICQLNGKENLVIGFQNDGGGYKLRNPNFQGSNSPRGIITFHHGASEVVVFERFFDFLSYPRILPFSVQKTS